MAPAPVPHLDRALDPAPAEGSRGARAQLLAALSALFLAGGLAASDGLFDPRGLFLATAAGLALVWAAALGSPYGRAPAASPGRPFRATRIVLGMALAAGLASQVFLAPGRSLRPAQPIAFRVLAASAGAVAAFGFARSGGARGGLRFPLLLAFFAAMGAVAIAASPVPPIDVWWFQQLAAQALRHGRNPYAITYPNIYGDARFYDPAFLSGGRVVAFPYPPLTVLLDLPAWLLLGDVRYLLLAAMLLAAWGIRRLGAGRTAELAALAFLFQPRAFFVLEQAWTEPVVMAAWILSVLAARRFLARAPTGHAAAGLAGGLLLASKQYSPLLVLPIWLALPRRGLGKATLVAGAAFAAVTVPFLLWDPGAFVRDVVVMQFLQPFRPDALSWLAAWARLTGRRLPAAPAFALAAAALVATLPRRPPLPQAAAATGAALFLLLLFNRQAFCNYYWLAGGIAVATCALLDAPGSAEIGRS